MKHHTQETATKPSIFVTRPLALSEHWKLREQKHRIDAQMPDAALHWRKLGKAGIMLLRTSEYMRLTSLPHSKLASRPLNEMTDYLNHRVLAGNKLVTPTEEASFMKFGSGNVSLVGFSVCLPTLAEERNNLTTSLDELNGISREWLPFIPYIALARLDTARAQDKDVVLKAFEAIRPREVTLSRPQAMTR